MQLRKHDFGSCIALGIEDENKENIERQYFSFWNHGATSGELHWVTDKFAYFWTSPEALNHSLIEAALFKLLNVDCGRSKGKKKGLMPEAIKAAQSVLDKIEPACFIEPENLPDELTMPYKMGYIEFVTPDLSCY